MDRPVFISYSSSDKDAADKICAALEAAGHGCWIAPRDIDPGADYPSAILAGLQQARLLVVVISSAAVASPHVLTEIGHAFSERKPIVPIRLSATALPADFDYFLSTSQWLDAHDGCTAEHLARLCDAVSRALAGAPLTEPEQGKRLDKRILAAGGALVLAVGGIAYWLWPAPNAPPEKPRPTDAGISAPSNARSTVSETKPAPWVNPKDGLAYVWIPPGTFTMGCSPGDSECSADEGPSHPVEFTEGFWIGRTEVTNAAYSRVVPSWSYPANEARLPVVGISWRNAKAYCVAAGGRLPTEAEWEFAARGGTTGPYYGVPSRVAWYAANSGGVRHEVGALQPNAYGLYDVLGNASEWVLDRYYRKYEAETPQAGRTEQPLAPNASAVARGGFWESEAQNVRVSRRAEMDNREPGPMAGIRCVVERR